MNTETPCPYCKGIHYSSYNAERCRIRHELAADLASFEEMEAEKEKRKVKYLEGDELLAAYKKWRDGPRRGRRPENIRYAFE